MSHFETKKELAKWMHEEINHGRFSQPVDHVEVVSCHLNLHRSLMQVQAIVSFEANIVVEECED